MHVTDNKFNVTDNGFNVTDNGFKGQANKCEFFSFAFFIPSTMQIQKNPHTQQGDKYMKLHKYISYFSLNLCYVIGETRVIAWYAINKQYAI